MPSNCPHRFTLSQHLRGMTCGTIATELDEHLATCDRCLQTMGTLESDDEFTERLRNANPVGRETTCNELAERVSERIFESTSLNGETLIDVSSAGDDQQVVLQHLSPSSESETLGSLGRYTLHSVLGEGGMGIVYRAFDHKLQRDVAIKVLRPSLATQLQLRRRFVREARAGSFSHDHVAAVYDVGEECGLSYIAMEVLEGESLQERLEREPVLAVAEALRITREVALALQVAHARGLIHRDIKPANIWLDHETSRARLVDFGLAGGSGSDGGLTQSGVVLGTPKFMSPEQATAGTVDHRTDLFSLGSVLYRMVTGTFAIDGQSSAECFAALLSGQVRDAAEVNPDVPAELSELIGELMQPDPAERLASADFLLAQLECLKAEAVVPPAAVAEDSGRGRGKTPTHRSFLSWIAGAAGLVLLGIIVITIRHKDGTTTKLELDDQNVESVTVTPAADAVMTGAGNASSPRQVAAWILDSGGKIGVAAADSNEPTPVDTVPTGSFTLVSVGLPGLCSPADLKRIAGLTGLTHLECKLSSDWTAADFAVFQTLKTLRYLNLTIPAPCSIRDDQTRCLCRLSRLEYLHLAAPALTGSFFEDIVWLEKLEHLSLDMPSLTDESVRLIARSPSLYVLRIDNGRLLTDQSLQNIVGSQLVQLDIVDSQITGDGFPYLTALKNLQWLRIPKAPVSDDSLAHLSGCRRLNQLDLSGTQITDAGIKHLARLRPLEWLTINDCQVTDAAAVDLSLSSQLTKLWAQHTGLSDAGLLQLAKSKTLTELRLASPQITDEGLKNLHPLKTLRSLDLHRTSVTPTGVSALKQQIPNIQIYRY